MERSYPKAYVTEKAEKALRHSISVRDVINMLAVNMVWIRKGVHL